MPAPYRTRRRFASASALAIAMALVAVTMPNVSAERRGRGLTANFEANYLKMAIDHHFSALRITELAAGTDERRDDEISSREGTSPTPGFAPTEARSDSEEIKGMARQANRMQREEILMAQRFLKEWYGINYSPRLTAEAKQASVSSKRATAASSITSFSRCSAATTTQSLVAPSIASLDRTLATTNSSGCAEPSSRHR